MQQLKEGQHNQLHSVEQPPGAESVSRWIETGMPGMGREGSCQHGDEQALDVVGLMDSYRVGGAQGAW
ncbi:hypothetical protein D3C81_1700210 [compost metagenome]